MKIRLPQYELIFVTVLCVVQTFKYLSEIGPAPFVVQSDHVLLSLVTEVRVVTVWVFFGVYLVLRSIVVPIMRKSFDPDRTARNIALSIAAILIVSVALIIGVNVLTMLAKPHLRNYNGHALLALFGYREPPIHNYLDGFDRSLILVLVLTGILTLRSWILDQVYKLKQRREFWIDALNQAGFMMLLLFLFALSEQDPVNFRTASFLTTLLLIITLVYWIFPGIKKSFAEPLIWLRALVSLGVCSVPAWVFYFAGRSTVTFWQSTALVIVIALPVAYFIYRRNKERFLKLGILNRQLATTQANLQQLKSQINPHFLFNALNGIYGTALKEGADHAASGIQKLGDMMRFMLTDNEKDSISLEKEIEYLQNYIDLQTLRMSIEQTAHIKTNIEEMEITGMVPPMILIPFVENAFKHGISSMEPSWISIDLYGKDGRLFLTVKNSIHESLHKQDHTHGIGINNVAERLKMVYADRYKLEIKKSSEEFIVNLQVPLNNA